VAAGVANVAKAEGRRMMGMQPIVRQKDPFLDFLCLALDNQARGCDLLVTVSPVLQDFLLSANLLVNLKTWTSLKNSQHQRQVDRR